MNRAELLSRLTAYPVSVSVDGSAPLPLTIERSRELAGTEEDIRVMDTTILPHTLRAFLKDDGSFDGRRVRRRPARPRAGD